MKIGIYGQFYHENSGVYIQELLNVLAEEQLDVCVEEGFWNLIDQNKAVKKNYRHFQTFKKIDTSFDLFISVGGDGTILKAVNYIQDLGTPVVGINTGRLGFLATVNKEDIRSTIHMFIKGDYSISERSLLTVKTDPKGEDLCEHNYALNEIAVSRKNTTSMITIETWLDQEYLTSYWADGLIISTPTGSTGYSLSCGGPVITPSTKALVITPIAPHNLNARPLIIKDNTKISLRVTGREEDYLISMDSRIASLKNNTSVIIKKAPFKLKMVQFSGGTFLKTLRKKLLWGEDKRN